jgi:DNA topoisomerase-6 subunit B
LTSGTQVTEVSPAQWFHRNRELAGFTNPSRALFVSVRELVENALESAEVAGVAPKVVVNLSQVGGAKPVEKDGEGAVPLSQKAVYKLSVEDNGPGLAVDKIPRAFGQFLVSSHYRFVQARGIFGIGAKAAVMYAQSTTMEPAVIESSTDGKTWHRLAIEIDLKENRAKIIEQSEYKAEKTGLRITITLLGDYSRAKSKIIDYLDQTAMIAPYAEISYYGPDEQKHYKPLTDELPAPPKEMQPHPSGADTELIKLLVAESRRSDTLSLLLRKNFQRLGAGAVSKISAAAGLDPKMRAKELTSQQIARVVEIMHNTSFPAPDPSCLSPVSDEALKLGMERLLEPEWVKAVQRKPSAYSGYPFVVTAALAFGGDKLPVGVTLFRFANKIPLLFDEGSDVSKVIINEMDWRRYKVDLASHRIAVAVSLVSVKIPFKTAGKEYIGDVDEVRDEIRLAIQQLARGLMLHLSAKEKKESQSKRQSIYDTYVPLALKFLSDAAGVPAPKVVHK